MVFITGSQPSASSRNESCERKVPIVREHLPSSWATMRVWRPAPEATAVPSNPVPGRPPNQWTTAEIAAPPRLRWATTGRSKPQRPAPYKPPVPAQGRVDVVHSPWIHLTGSTESPVCGEQLERTAATFSAALVHIRGNGQDAQRFTTTWNPQHRGQLTRTGLGLRQAAEALNKNADEQEKASAGDDGMHGGNQQASRDKPGDPETGGMGEYHPLPIQIPLDNRP
ncbi:hypothetical protein [Arthrobacter alpinus]|uniref:hypothetical protein n=1 Tax=Arthrobacter alpinus TaxID=656366 RepID=UPI0016484F26|nr:hypothetical protein [Arthrobacter alpinus]